MKFKFKCGGKLVCHHIAALTLKNSLVDPESSVPYAISVCLARSSALSMGDTILSTVRKAARLAVYEEMMISVKNHQTPPTIRPDRDLQASREGLSHINNRLINNNSVDNPSANIFQIRGANLYPKRANVSARFCFSRA